MLDEKAANLLTERIRAIADNLWDLIVLAYRGRAWAALGYPSWDTYCAKELGDLKIRLPKEDRREIMASLRDQGLSLRAISSATGYDKHTVSRDLEVVPATSITGVNGKNYRKPPADSVEVLWRTACTIAKMGDKVAKLAGNGNFGTATEASLRELLRTRQALDEVIAKLEGAFVA